MEKSESTDSKLRLAWVRKAIEHNMSFQDYRLVTEWLGCFQYVLPDDRNLLGGVVSELAERLIRNLRKNGWVKSKSIVFGMYLQADLIETTLTIEEQKELMPWMSA